MSFKTKVQKIVLDMSDGPDYQKLKKEIVNSVRMDINNKYQEVVQKSIDDWEEVMDKLQKWKVDPVKLALYELLKEMPLKEKKKLFKVD